jgi:NADH-quinone oxidoreductase subunit N
VTALLSVGSKGGGFVVLLRVLQPFFIAPEMHRLLAIVAGITLIYGNLAALPQANLKRLLAYSSIAHAGYLLVAVVSLSGTSVTFYLVAYLLMTLLSFGVLCIIGQNAGDDLTSYNGLATRSPFLAFAMLISMASLAGVPFTAGFLGKFFVFDAAIRQQHWTLVIIGVITVACGFYYYFKVIRSMYWESATQQDSIPVSGLTRLTMTLLMLAIFVLGVYPTLILNALH